MDPLSYLLEAYDLYKDKKYNESFKMVSKMLGVDRDISDYRKEKLLKALFENRQTKLQQIIGRAIGVRSK